MLIQGNTDERGTSEYNLALGQKRAEAVRRAMSLLGVADSQMEAVSLGKKSRRQPGMTSRRGRRIAALTSLINSNVTSHG